MIVKEDVLKIAEGLNITLTQNQLEYALNNYSKSSTNYPEDESWYSIVEDLIYEAIEII